jgi:hypothetical protein
MLDSHPQLRLILDFCQRILESRWFVSVASLVAGAFFGFFFGWLKERLKESRENELLREAIYQELANNCEALLYWVAPERVDFDWLKQNFAGEITFFAYEAAGKNPGGFYRIPEHGWMIAGYREMRKLAERGPTATDLELIDLLHKALATIGQGDRDRPATKERLRSKLLPEYRDKIV